MTSICILLHNYYETDIRVRRKAEALVSAGYHVDLLSLRSKYSKAQNYTLDGVNIYTIVLGKKRGSLLRYFYSIHFSRAGDIEGLVPHAKEALRGHRRQQPSRLPGVRRRLCKMEGRKNRSGHARDNTGVYISKYAIKPDAWLVRVLEYIEQASLRSQTTSSTSTSRLKRC